MSGKHKETGQYAYEGYASAVGYRNYQGGLMPRWAELPGEIKNAWREAAHAVMRYGWQSPDPPEVPQGWEHAGGWHSPPGVAGALFIGDDPDDTRTSHRIRGDE